MRKSAIYLGCLIYAIGFWLQSCSSNTSNDTEKIISRIAKDRDINVGSFNFDVDLPENWYRLDTTISNLRVTMLLNSDERYVPRISITNESMGFKSHQAYILSTKQTLVREMADVVIGEEGTFNVSGKECKWYSYTKIYNGLKREMIFYSISINDISYCITAGVNDGGMKTYKPEIDSIVESFRFN